MQTFLPYASFVQSALVLDRQRLGKQRVEAQQLIAAIEQRPSHLRRLNRRREKEGKKPVTFFGWVNHPAAVMWRGYLPALILYRNVMIKEWLRRGYKNTLPTFAPSKEIILPPWVGDDRLHSSHRANLLRKFPEHYGRLGWNEDPSDPYFWPGEQ